MKFVIDRNKWLRGEGAPRSFLLRSDDQKMCCLGIFLKALGATDESLCNTQTPADMPCNRSVIPDWMFRANTLLHEHPQNAEELYRLMETNDDLNLSDYERELAIEQFFVSKGIDVEFVE